MSCGMKHPKLIHVECEKRDHPSERLHGPYHSSRVTHDSGEGSQPRITVEEWPVTRVEAQK